MKTRYFALILMLVCGVSVFSLDAQIPTKTNEFRIGLKTGRTIFTNPEELGGQSTHVFYGQVAMDYGVCRANKVYYGLGIGAEYIDLLDTKVSVPLHADLRYYFSGDIEAGAFLEIQAGYAFCSDQSFPIYETVSGLEVLIGQTVRKLSGPFGEVFFGYRTHRFDFEVGYSYKVAHYLRSYNTQIPGLVYQLEQYGIEATDKNFFKPLHTFMAGVSYKIL